MLEYGLHKEEVTTSIEKMGKDHGSKEIIMTKYDSRGKEMKIKKLFIENGQLESYGNKKQFAVVNFNLNSLISRMDLK